MSPLKVFQNLKLSNNIFGYANIQLIWGSKCFNIALRFWKKKKNVQEVVLAFPDKQY